MNAMVAKGYLVFESDYKNFNLNIVGIRSNDERDNSFNDKMCVFWKFQGHWNFCSFSCTTDPGLYWRKNPLNKMGTAILKEGQHRGSYQLGKHQGKYAALVQRKELTVIRDYDRDEYLNFDGTREDTGFHGINIHRASHDGSSIAVNKWSAGCQVFENSYNFDFFIQLCEQSAEVFGNAFTYTLLNEDDL